MNKKNEKAVSTESITQVRKDNQGRLVEFKTDKGKIYDYEMACEAINQGQILNAEVINNRGGPNVIKGKNNNALDKLPEF